MSWWWWIGAALAEPAPTDGDAWIDRGGELLNEGRYLEAVEAFRKAEAMGLPPAVTGYNLAIALSRAGLPDQALEALRAAIDGGFSDLDQLHEAPGFDAIRHLPGFREATAELEIVDVLRIATGRDGLTATTASLRERIRAACTAGEPAACALENIDPRDRDAIGTALAPACAEAVPTACLGVAWTMLPPSPTGAFPEAPADVGAFVAAVRRACDGGVMRGCTELGYAWDLGLVAYPNRRKAKELWRAGCDAREPRACTAAAAVGIDRLHNEHDVLGMLTEGRGRGPQALRALERACLAGASVGCVRLAARTGALPEAALAAMRAACDEGDLASCALVAQIGLVAGTVTPDEALARLDAACPILPSACEEAAFLRQGAPPVPGYPDPPPADKEVHRGLFDLRPALFRCYLDAVRRQPDVEGWVDVVLRLDPAGRVVGVHVREPFDEPYRACVVDVLRTATIRPGGPQPGRAEASIPAFHGVSARLDPRTGAGDGAREAAQVAADSANWGPLARCAADRGVVTTDLELVVGLVAHRSGELTDVQVLEGIGEPEIERCIADWLGTRRVPERLGQTTPMHARIRLFQPREGERPAKPPPAFVLGGADDGGPPVVIRMLVLSVERSRIDRARSRLSARSIRSIEEAHREMARQVERMTGGRLRIEVTTRTVSERIDLRGAMEVDGLARYQILPDDLPPAVWQAIPPGEFDTVLIWGPIPLGFPRPALGVTYEGLLLGGATLSSGAIPSRRELRANGAVPRWELPLHEWWHQVESRAESLLVLQTAWPPRNHEVLEVGGHELDPRTWFDDTDDTVIPWYEHVLGTMPRAFWADVWGRGERIEPSEANLALRARPIGHGIEAGSGLADTVLDFGRYPPSKVTEDATDPWFGLAWPSPQRVGRIVVHTAPGPDETAWTDARIAIGARPARGDAEADDWVQVAAETVRDGDRWTFTFPPVEAWRIQVRPVADGPVGLREIEVYAE